MFGAVLGAYLYLRNHRYYKDDPEPTVKISKKRQLGHFLFVTGILVLLGYLILKH